MNGSYEHGMTEVGCNHRKLEPLMKFNCKIAGSAAKIEANGRIPGRQVFRYFRRGETPPTAIDGHREEMVQEIVAVGDFPEHLPDMPTIGTMKFTGGRAFSAGFHVHRSAL